MLSRMLSFIAAGTLLAASTQAAPLIIEPDDYLPGTDISAIVPGVLLSTVASDHGAPQVLSTAPLVADWASTGDLVFGHGGSFPEHWVTDTVPGYRFGALRADLNLSFAVTEIQFDLNGNDSGDVGLLEAFAGDGTLLGTYETAQLDADSFETATISSATPIAYLIAGGKGTNTITLDRLVLIPEPASAAMLAAGLLLLRRR